MATYGTVTITDGQPKQIYHTLNAVPTVIHIFSREHVEWEITVKTATYFVLNMLYPDPEATYTFDWAILTPAPEPDVSPDVDDGYCLPSDVRLLIASDLTDTQLTWIITRVDVDLDNLLDGAAMTDDLKRNCSMRLTAIVAAGYQKAETDVIGGPSSNQGGCIAEWQKYVDDKVAFAKGEVNGKRIVGKVVTHHHHYNSCSSVSDGYVWRLW
jgi:hypothetical protein